MLGMGQTVVTSVSMLIVDGTVLVKKRLETGEERRREGERKRRGREGERQWEGRREEGEEKGRRKRGRERGGGGDSPLWCVLPCFKFAVSVNMLFSVHRYWGMCVCQWEKYCQSLWALWWQGTAT